MAIITIGKTGETEIFVIQVDARYSARVGRAYYECNAPGALWDVWEWVSQESGGIADHKLSRALSSLVSAALDYSHKPN